MHKQMKTKTVHIRIFLTLLLSSVMPSLTNAAIHSPQLQIPLIKTAPVIDGKLNDAYMAEKHRTVGIRKLVT